MARPIEVGDDVTLRFPRYELEETYKIRAIQVKPDQTKIFIKKWFESKGEILTITSQGTVFSGKVQPIDITYINKDTKPAPTPVQSEEEYLVRLAEKLADDQNPLLDEYEYAEYFEDDIIFAIDHNYLGVLHMIATDNIEGFRQSNPADYAALSGHVEILRWLGSLNPPIYVENEDGNLFLDIVDNGYLDVLKYLYKGDYDEFMGDLENQLALRSVEGGTFYPEILKWIYETDPEYVRSMENELPNTAAARGHMEAITYLESLDPPIRPDKEGIEDARRNNHLDIVDYLESVPLTKSANKR
jgi:hypothetical protein